MCVCACDTQCKSNHAQIASFNRLRPYTFSGTMSSKFLSSLGPLTGDASTLMHRFPPEPCPLYLGITWPAPDMGLRLCGQPAMKLCVCQGVSPLLPRLPVEPVWPHWRPRVGSLPIGEAHSADQGCVPVLPLDQCDMHFRPEPGSLPQDHPGSGVVAPWLPLGQLHGISSTSPSSPCCPVCCDCMGAFTAGGARGSEAASTAYSIWRFLQKRCP